MTSFCVQGGGGVKKSDFHAYVLIERSLISLPYKQRALSGSIGEKLKEKMGHKLMIGSHYSYEYGKLPWPLGGHIVPLGGVMGYG